MYQNKYLKYKNKYLELKNKVQTGGTINYMCPPDKPFFCDLNTKNYGL